MREIKFRAWDKKEKKMYPISLLEWNWEEWKDKWYCKQMAGEMVNGEPIMYDIEKNLVVMQFTGLKDKNGVEIYEGDIVQLYRLSDGRKFQVLWKDYGWFLNAINHFSNDRPGNNFKSLVVIGNIYENPESLKESEKK